MFLLIFATLCAAAVVGWIRTRQYIGLFQLLQRWKMICAFVFMTAFHNFWSQLTGTNQLAAMNDTL